MAPTNRDLDTAVQLASIETKLDDFLCFTKWGFGGFAVLVISWLGVLSALHLVKPDEPHHNEQCSLAIYGPVARDESAMAQ